MHMCQSLRQTMTEHVHTLTPALPPPSHVVTVLGDEKENPYSP